ncbi:hypothetical protein INS49_011740 [Diaporthe citri]|uniref:uncharacterized protein n=1 Tax=Diaporthe citri TaxID=83186 RepID=UPI001C7EBCC5|nr:uncharacterized protein INS49_011740 [Diaporthe citri]KAG6360675.1 hypothetical protein INS49_011740 [Diaporthe citri]
MGNWKELGVVPDSDDEGFDSEDSLPPPARYSPPKPPLEKRHDDIWEFSGSSGPVDSQQETTTANLLHERTLDKPSEPPSTASEDLGTEAQHASYRGRRDAPSSSLTAGGDVPDHMTRGKIPQNKLESSSAVQSLPTTIPPERDEISSSVVQILAPSANPFPGSSLKPGPEARFPGVHREANHNSQPPNQPQSTHIRRDRPVESSPRAGRSLRPRKPIQEHPYLLENAQYSRFMKSHGVKPIHIALQEQNLSKSLDKNVSQEQDYTGGESQPTSVGPGEESQGLRTNTFSYSLDDDVDELALSPSPRTSSSHRQPQTSSEHGRSQQTDDTSINGEEFPDIKDLALKPTKPIKPSKRTTPSRSTTSRKRLKSRHEMLEQLPQPVHVDDDWDIPPSPGPLRVDPALANSPTPDSSPRPFFQSIDDTFASTSLQRRSNGADVENWSELVDLTNDLEGGEDEDASELEDRSSGSDSDIIQRTGKRIKGVLPASWLRLDQQTNKTVQKGALKRPTSPRSPDGRQRGVATVRHATAMVTSNFLQDFDDDDEVEEEREEDAPGQTVDLLSHGLGHELSSPSNGLEGIDDNLSVIEEDYVDWMLPGGKRNRTSRGIPNKKRKNTQQRLFKGEQRYRQPKISNSLHCANRSSSGAVKTWHPKTNAKKKTQKTRAASPPALGITDVVEPSAPRFIRIAARAASRRQDLGRSKPNNKAINLGTRKDNVEVHSILRDWTMGNIKQKALRRQPTSGLSRTGQDARRPRRPLGQLSSNITKHSRPRAGVSFRKPSKVTRQVSLNNFVITSKAAAEEPRPEHDSTRRTAPGRTQSHNLGDDYLSRPAQLEADILHGGENTAFIARKKMLDLVFRKTRKEILAPTFHFQRCPSDEAQPVKNQNEVACSEHSILGLGQHNGRISKTTKARFRKQIAPKRLDLDAPQFRHANDPLLPYEAPVNEECLEAPRQEQSKIVGLGPYGTQYTHHFDIFPLQEDVFFHHSTLIGNGTLKKALDCHGVVGTIFDFFGQQNLSNLRNEEVNKSPQFLENLGGRTSLSVDAEDRCFHIFLKMLALAIQTMRKRGLSNDIRNLIARTLPNHDRQYSKEQTIHAHDLAALRNHHDLLCTLFWAAPPEERPAVHLIEKLVSPGSSHKEAVLVNLRAWRQLATFVVSSGATVDVYGPLMKWQNHVFEQVLEQYHLAAGEIQRQFMSMPSETKKDIGQQVVDSFVSANQTAAKDVLHFSVMASLAVMKNSPSLASAMFSFNTVQLRKALTNASTDGKDLDCGVLQGCFETVELFLERLEKLGDVLKEESDDSLSSSSDNREYADAVELLDEKVVQGFFIAVRQVLSSSVSVRGSYHDAVSIIREKAITLSGRIASMLISGGKRSLKHFFSIGKYGLFENAPQNLSLDNRIYLPLFVATLLKNHVFDFSSIGCSHFDIWLLSLVKPFHALKYEMHLAETLKMLDLGYMRRAAVIDGMRPNYRTNRDFFACAVSHMRKEIQQSDPSRRMPLRAKYEKLLKLVMQQMRLDITSLDLNSDQHKDYTSFVREIVALIQSHGTGISLVDSFYLQASAEFSPATEDPKLHSAVIVGYGLRLGEGDTTAGPQLFSFLYNHFKRFMADGQLDAESKIIENGMTNDNILAFALGRMMPAIIQTACKNPEVWPLLGVYSKALGGLFGRSPLPREIPEKSIDHSISLLETILGYLGSLKEQSTPETAMSPPQVQLFAQMMEVCHAIRPRLICWLLQPSLDPTKRLQGCIDKISLISRQANAYLDGLRGSQGREMPLPRVIVGQLLAGLADTATSDSVLSGADGQVINFAQRLQHEMQSCWTITDVANTATVAATSSTQLGSQPGQRISTAFV